MKRIILLLLLIGIIFALYWFYIKFEEEEAMLNLSGNKELLYHQNKKQKNKIINEKVNKKHNKKNISISSDSNVSLHSFDISVMNNKNINDESNNSDQSNKSFDLPHNEEYEDDDNQNEIMNNNIDNESEHSFALSKQYSD